VHRLHTAGINVAIGTDGAASNNNLDLMEEMRTAALLGKAVAEDASACDAKYMLEMATINAAKAMGCADDLGSLEIGKLADITALEISGPEAFPLYHPLSWLIYAASSRQVSHVWVAGKALLTEGQHNTLDVPAIYAKAQDWATKIRNSLT
jgi:5-methylthioadenosine/S-adenosylhomocysteine deaminase